MNAWRKTASVLALASAAALSSGVARADDAADEKTGESRDHQFWTVNPWWGWGGWGYRPWGWGWGFQPWWGGSPWLGWGGVWGVRPWGWGWGW